MGQRKRKPNSVPGSRKGSKWPEEVRTACLCALLTHNNLSDVAKRHGVPESTLRTWLTEANKLDENGKQSVFAAARAAAVREVTHKAAEGALLSVEMMNRRLHKSMEYQQRNEAIIDIVANPLVQVNPQVEEKLKKELMLKRPVSDFTMSNYARTLVAISKTGAAEQNTDGAENGATLESMLETVTGDEW